MTAIAPDAVAARLKRLNEIDAQFDSLQRSARIRALDTFLCQKIDQFDAKIDELLERWFPGYVEGWHVPAPTEWQGAPVARPAGIPALVQSVLLVECGRCGRRHWAPREGYAESRKRYTCPCGTVNLLPLNPP